MLKQIIISLPAGKRKNKKITQKPIYLTFRKKIIDKVKKFLNYKKGKIWKKMNLIF
jgi:hypothetical protein